MKSLLEYHKEAQSLNLGQCKTARLIATINYLHKKGVEPDVKKLADLSRKDIQKAKYDAVQIKPHRDNTIL